VRGPGVDAAAAAVVAVVTVGMRVTLAMIGICRGRSRIHVDRSGEIGVHGCGGTGLTVMRWVLVGYRRGVALF